MDALMRKAIFEQFCSQAKGLPNDVVPPFAPDFVHSSFNDAINNDYDARVDEFVARLLLQQPDRCVDVFAGNASFFDATLFSRTSLMIDTVGDRSVPYYIIMLFNSCFERIIIVPRSGGYAEKFRPFAWNFQENVSCVFTTEAQFEAQFWNIEISHSLSNSTMKDLENMLCVSKENIGLKVTSTILKLTLVFRHLSDILTVGTVLVDLCLLWGVPTMIAQSTWNMISEYIKLKHFYAQSAMETFDPFKTMICVVSGLCAVAGSMRVPDQKMLDYIMMRVSNMGRACKGFEAILDAVQSNFSKVYNYVYLWTFGAPPRDTDFESMFAGLEEWFNSVKNLSKFENLTSLNVDYKRCREVETLFLEGLEYVSKFNLIKISSAERASFNHHWAIVSKIYDKVVAKGLKRAEPRTEPLVIHLFGDSGVGKSGLTYLLAQDILSLENMADDVMEEVYFRNVEQEYWDGYRAQTITVYDDFGQMKDTSARPNPEFMEVIRLGNIAPMNLHMAHLEEKDKTRFTSRAVILTSNRENFPAESLTHKEAFDRRLDIHVRVSIKSRYKNASGHVDETKVEDALSDKIYEFTPYTSGGYPIMTTLNKTSEPVVWDYDQFREKVFKAYVKRYSRSKKKLACLNVRAQTLPDRSHFWAQSGDSVLQADVLILRAWLQARDPDSVRWSRVFGDVHCPDEVFSSLTELATTIDNFMDFEQDALSILVEKFESSLQVFTSPTPEFKTWKDKVRTAMSESKKFVDVKFMHARKITLELIDAVRMKANEVFSAVPPVFKALGVVFGVFISGFAGMKLLKQFSEADKKPTEVKTLLTTVVNDEMEAETVEVDRRPKNQILRAEAVVPRKVEPKVIDCDQLSAETWMEERKPRKTVLRAEDGGNQSKANKRGKKFTPEAAKDYNARELVATAVHANTYLATTFNTSDDAVSLANCVFVVGRIGIIVYHATHKFKTFIKIQNAYCPDGYIVRVSDLKISRIHRDGVPLDLISICFPRSVPRHVTILKHFVNVSDINRFRTADATLCSAKRTSKGSKTVFSHVLYNTRCIEAVETENYSLGNEPFRLRNGYKYRCDTEPGDCTAPLVINAPSIQRKIVGFHVAGNKEGFGIAQSVTHEMLEAHIKENNPFEAQISIELQDPWIDEFEIPLIPDGNFIPVGKTTRPVGKSLKTKLHPSMLHNTYLPSTTRPAILGNVEVDGELVDPMELGLRKFGKQPPPLDPVILMRCKTWMSNYLKQFAYGERRLMTWEECISGIEADPWYQPVNRSSSAGYPWVFSKGSSCGKREWLGYKEDYKYDHPELVAKCEEQISKAKEGILLPPVFIDTLKDERRPHKKVDAGKTRVFSAGPMDYVLNVRRYFLAFNAAMMHNRIDNDFGPGINPFSNDWHRLALHLKKKGPLVWAGDYSGFDASLLSELVYAACDIINDWYDDGEENRKVREVLFAGMINALHLNGDNLVMFTHSQPSGNPLTTMINCIINVLIMAYNFAYITGRPMSDFNKLTSRIVFGDDHVINVHESIADIFNQVTFAQACKDVFGMDYTDENKTGILVPTKSLEEVGFLKRNFYFREETAMYVGQLDHTVILEIPQWVRGDEDHVLRCVENCETAFKELSIYGKEFFEEWSAKIFKACRNANMTVLPELLSYEDYQLMEIDYLVG